MSANATPPPLARYAVLGHPVAQSRSPFIHQAFARQTGHSLRYERVLVPLDGFAATLDRLAAEGLLGCNVTVPFKFEALAAARQCSERARLAGAANLLVRRDHGWWADNTDGVGLLRDIEQGAGFAVAGSRVLLIGAGGASAGVLGPLLQARPAQVRIVNRNAQRSLALAERHAGVASDMGVVMHAGGLDAPGQGHDLVINATAASLAGAPVPVPATVLGPGALAVDLMYGPAAEPFLAWARAAGAQARDGLGMLVEQAAESFVAWRGVRPDTTSVLDELRVQLGQEAA